MSIYAHLLVVYWTLTRKVGQGDLVNYFCILFVLYVMYVVCLRGE